jgi:hypothetical protein
VCAHVEGGEVSSSVRTFATSTASLIELGEWLTTARFVNNMQSTNCRVFKEKVSLCDLPLKFHPAAIRASAVDTPFGAV